ncbi:MAG: HEAT repeat domain-containing protein [Anaerolineales bacterium]|nr:HEAT repeat domain-containing protein [Anaerolineales bacterium]
MQAARCPHCGGTADDENLPFADRLILSLRHPEPTRAGLAIDILAKNLRERRAVPPMIELLRTTGDFSVQRQAAEGLGILGDRKAVPALIDLLENPTASLTARREAALALGRLGGKAAAAALRRACSDKRESIAEAAEEAFRGPANNRKAPRRRKGNRGK